MDFSLLIHFGKRAQRNGIHQGSSRHRIVAWLLANPNVLPILLLTMQFSPIKRFAQAILCCCLFPLAMVLAAEDISFDPSLPAHSMCTVEIAILRPTQSAVGMKEVEIRAEKIGRMTPNELEHYLRKHVAPIAIGPGGVPYLLDHQHLARALLQARVGKTLYAEVKENWSKLSEPEFWTRMKERDWVYLHDETGKPVPDSANLPQTIGSMRDDPYRSLAWLVREKEGYQPTESPYADFHWANFFRARVHLGNGTNAFDEATTEAMKVAHSPEAKDLPGYVAATDKTSH
jgi:hypothetical protein